MLTPDEIDVLNTWKSIAELWEHRSKYLVSAIERAFERGSIKGFEDMPAFAFNSQGINPNYGGGGGGLPVGKHPVTITASVLKPTADNTGGMMVFTLTAFDGPAKGQSQDDRLNLHNKNPKAVEIANEQLAAYCVVTNTPAFQATEELHNKPFVVEIGQQKTNPQYTEVVGLFDMQGNKPGSAGAGPQTSQGQGNYQPPQGQPQGFGAGGGIPPQGQGQPQGGAPQGGGNAWGNQGGGAPQGQGFGQGQPQGQGQGGFDPNAQGQGQPQGGQGFGGGAPQGQGQPQGNGAWGGQGAGQGQPQGGGQAWQQGGGGAPQGGGQPGWGAR